MGWRTATRFYHDLRILLDAGFAIDEAAARAGTSTGPPYRRWAAALGTGCAAGRPLSELLAEHGERPLAIGLLCAGERSGHIGEACRELESFYEHLQRLRRLLIGRSIYPVLLLHAALIAPALVGALSGKAEPWTIAIGPAVLWTAVLAVLLSLLAGKRSGYLAAWGLRPPASAVLRPLITANVCLVLRAAHRAGMLWPDALELAAASCGNSAWAALLTDSARRLRHGEFETLAQALQAAALPEETVSLCANAERAGSLEQALGRAAELARERFQERSLWATRIAAGLLYGAALVLAVITIFRLFYQIYAPVFEMLE